MSFTTYGVQYHQLLRLVTRFASTKDKSGNLRYPLFEELKVTMGGLMEINGKLRSMPDGTKKLALAYDLAMRTFVTQDETNEMLRRTLSRKGKK